MESFSWNNEKNEQLLRDRGITFERAVFHILAGDLLDIVEHPNQRRYPGQRIFVININEYAYLVPFVTSESGYFLKTIIPSRKATNTYIRRS